jgi:hypothetical protein
VLGERVGTTTSVMARAQGRVELMYAQLSSALESLTGIHGHNYHGGGFSFVMFAHGITGMIPFHGHGSHCRRRLFYRDYARYDTLSPVYGVY